MMREWSEYEFVEAHARLDINALHRAGALVDRVTTQWRWPNGLEGYLRGAGHQISWVGQTEQPIRWDWIPCLNGDYVRPRFLCPSCGRGAYQLHDRAGVWACRNCGGFDYRCRHRQQRFGPTFRRIAMLRRKLGADPGPLSPLPPAPRQRSARARYVRLARAIARAEAALANLPTDRRASS